MASISSDDIKQANEAAEKAQLDRFSLLNKELGESNLTIIVFGASGHLAKTKTYPALFDLFVEGILPKSTTIVGFARSKSTDSEFQEKIEGFLKGDKAKDFVKLLTYYQAKNYDDDNSYLEFSKYLSSNIESDEKCGNKANRLCYMALPPSVFGIVFPRVRKYIETTKDQGWTRVIVEKPFGKDLESCNALLEIMSENFEESQTFRIDHYLAKEMVQNIFVFRFANTIWDSIWDRKSIRCVKISMKETAGVDGRGGYYDEFGVLRDIFQNHLMQVLTLIAMEQPVTMNANDIRDEKVKVLKAIEPISLRRSILGQYTKSSDGKMAGYLDDESVQKINPNSRQITFAQCVVFIKNGRWNGVPFICKCGKALDAKNTEVRVQFKNDGLTLFGGNSAFNELVIRLQPNEAIWLKVNTKTPGFAGMDSTQPYELDLTYKHRLGDVKLPEAYTRLILECLEGQHANFVRNDELRESWRICTPILHELEQANIKPTTYPRGSRGPQEADQMAEKYGFLRNGGYAWSSGTPPVKMGSTPNNKL